MHTRHTAAHLLPCDAALRDGGGVGRLEHGLLPPHVVRHFHAVLHRHGAVAEPDVAPEGGAEVVCLLNRVGLAHGRVVRQQQREGVLLHVPKRLVHHELADAHGPDAVARVLPQPVEHGLLQELGLVALAH